MTSDSHDRSQPQSMGAIPVRYAMLLGQYVQNRKELEDKGAKEGYRAIKNFLMGRKYFSNRASSEKAGFRVSSIDYFGADMKFSGGMEVLESLAALDVATLAAFIEINRINLLRIDRKLFIRRSAAFLIAGIGIVVPLLKMSVFREPVVVDVSKVLAHSLFRWWQVLWYVTAICIAGIIEMEVLRPGKSRAEEFGQMLDVAFAYVSKPPGPESMKKPPFWA